MSSSSSSSSAYSSWKELEKLHHLYRAMFGHPFAEFPPPPPPPPPYSFNVPQRPSKLPHPSVIVPHPRIPDVYVAADRNLDDLNDSESLFLYTRNLIPGFESHDQDVLFSVQDEDVGTVEYREWDPYKSRLAAAILSGAQNIWIKRSSRVLVILSRDDAQFGFTISHISDIVGPEGMVYVVEESTSNCHSLLRMAENRSNIVPIGFGFSCLVVAEYSMLINFVDVLFAAPNPDRQPEAVATYLNATLFLKTGGHYMLYVQGKCTESTNQGDGVFTTLSKQQKVQFQRKERVTLEPFDRDHAYVSGVFRTLEIDQSCLVSYKFATSQDIHGGVRRPVTLYEKLKDLPKYMLFESSYGYALFQVFGMHNIETHYDATEKFIKNFDKSFGCVARYAFESTDEALKHLNATKNEILPEKLYEFLDKYLPSKRMEGNEHCFSLVLLNTCAPDKIVAKAKIACSTNVIHIDIARGLRMNINKFFNKLKPGELEAAQVNLARSYCRQKRDSLDEGNLPKKRGASLVSPPTRQNPRRKARTNTNTK